MRAVPNSSNIGSRVFEQNIFPHKQECLLSFVMLFTLPTFVPIPVKLSLKLHGGNREVLNGEICGSAFVHMPSAVLC